LGVTRIQLSMTNFLLNGSDCAATCRCVSRILKKSGAKAHALHALARSALRVDLLNAKCGSDGAFRARLGPASGPISLQQSDYQQHPNQNRQDSFGADQV